MTSASNGRSSERSSERPSAPNDDSSPAPTAFTSPRSSTTHRARGCTTRGARCRPCLAREVAEEHPTRDETGHRYAARATLLGEQRVSRRRAAERAPDRAERALRPPGIRDMHIAHATGEGDSTLCARRSASHPYMRRAERACRRRSRARAVRPRFAAGDTPHRRIRDARQKARPVPPRRPRARRAAAPRSRMRVMERDPRCQLGVRSREA